MNDKGLPNARPERIWGGPGTGKRCALCNEPIERHQSELELQFAAGGGGELGLGTGKLSGGMSAEASYHVHARCFAAWHLEWQNRRVLPRRNEEGIICADECDAANGARAR